MNGNMVIITGLAIIVWAVHTLVKINYSVHILQLNGYFTDRYIRWINNNKSRVFILRDILPIVAIGFIYIGRDITAGIIWLAVYGLFTVLDVPRYKKQGEKKKLVYTSRVKRLLVTVVLLLAAAAGWSTVLLTGNELFPALFILLLVNMLAFFVTALANILNQPLERAITNWYYHDARRLLVSMPDLRVIGITGSYGKTSTKLILKRILAERYNVLATPESYNTTMGVVITTRTMLKPVNNVFIVEMGARQKGDIKEICDLVQPGMGILTAIGEQHLETFHDLDNIKHTKNELLKSMAGRGVAFVNADDENIASLPEVGGVRYVRYGINNDNLDYRAGELKYNSRGAAFTVYTPQGQAIMQTRLLGKHNIYNILGAVAAAAEMGMDLATISYAVKKLEPVEHRLQVKKSAGITIIDDAYNSNPVGAGMALEVLGQMPASRRILITPGMVELGEREHEFNRAFGRQAASSCDYIILVGPRQTAPIQEGLQDMNYPPGQLYLARDLKDALQHLKTVAILDSVVLFENDLPDTYNE